jgi:GLPGLI family protein
MRRIILVFSMLLAVIMVKAQQQTNGFLLAGTVVYEQTTKLDIQLEGDAAQFAHALPKERKSEKVLHFTEEAARYENHKSEDHSETSEMHGGGTMMVKMVEPDNILFTDLDNKIRVEQKEFMSRIFLIESDCEKPAWKITGGQKEILDYPCQEAVLEEEGQVIKAWFTPKITVSSGPETYGSLPGLVLAVDINEGEQIIAAKSVDLKPIDKSLLVKPKKGKKVTHEEFEAIVEEKMKEMGAEHGAGGNHTVVVKIQR